METLQFEPMSVGRIFDRAFLIYRNNFLRFITIVAVIEVPLALLSIASSSWMETRAPARQSSVSDQTSAQSDARLAARQRMALYEGPSVLGSAGTLLGVLLRLVGAMLCQAALIKNVSEAYLRNEITIGEAYRFALPKALTLLLASLCVGLVVGLGFLLLVVPGVIFALWFFLTTPAIVVENHSVTSGMSRSKALVGGNLGKVFAVGFLVQVLTVIIAWPLGYVAGWAGGMLFSDSLTLQMFVIHLATLVSQILLLPISAGAFILLYYDLRIRKEGFDLQMLAQSMASGQGELRAI